MTATAVARRDGDFDAAEDAVREALVAAAMHWPAEGLPDDPRGWLIQTAVRRLTDQDRSDQARRRRKESAALREPPGAAGRPARAAVHVPSSGADPGVLDRADAARSPGCPPERSEVTGLPAPMLLNDAPRPARSGALIPLAEHDRTRWNRPATAEGARLAATAMSGGVVGEYQLQAAIAALHDGAERCRDPDWPQILGPYGLLARLSGNPMVELNLAVAAAARTTSEPERQHLVTEAAKLNKQNPLDLGVWMLDGCVRLSERGWAP